MKTIRWGIAGPGNIANKFAKAVKNVEGACLAAVASTSSERGSAFAQKYDIPKVFTSYEDMATSDEVDAVYVATPHPFHKGCAEIFLKAGKHVLCEKPICINTAQAKALRDCARENGVFLMEAMWTKFLPAIKEVQNIVNSGEIGEIRGITADFCYNSTPREEAKIFRNDMAGGSLLDVGIYGLQFAALFLGYSPDSINSVCRIGGDVDLHTSVTMEYADGAIATITSALNVAKPASAYIYGSEGYVFVPDFYGAKEAFVYKNGEERHIDAPSIGDGFEEEIYEACACIREGRTESSIHPMEHSIALLEQMDSIRRSHGIKYPFEGEEI